MKFSIFSFRFVASRMPDAGIRFLRASLAAFFCLALCSYTMAPAYAGGASIRGAFSFSGFATGIGARAMGMNGAFAAVSDDSSSAYWNPAGLTSSWYKELSFTRADLYDLDLITSNTLNISTPETTGGAISFGWTRLQFDFESWREETFLVSYAKTLIGNNGNLTALASAPMLSCSSFSLSCGVTLKYLRQTSELEITSPLLEPQEEGETASDVLQASSPAPAYCKAKGFGLDAGLIARIRAKDGRNRLSIGIIAQEIPTVIKWNSGDGENEAKATYPLETEEYMPCRYLIGCSSEPLPRLTIALDLVGEQSVRFKEIHLGMEHWIFPPKYGLPISEKNLAIRGGIAKQLAASKRMTFAGGLSVRWAAWQLDYAYLMDNNGLGDTRNRFSVSIRF